MFYNDGITIITKLYSFWLFQVSSSSTRRSENPEMSSQKRSREQPECYSYAWIFLISKSSVYRFRADGVSYISHNRVSFLLFSDQCRGYAGTLQVFWPVRGMAYWVFSSAYHSARSLVNVLFLAPMGHIRKATLWVGLLYLTPRSESGEGET